MKTATLREIFSETLANLAFMFTDDDLPFASSGEAWFETSIRYDGPQSGELRLLCDRAFMKDLAGNLLGTDQDDPDADAKGIDAVKELMNILCGQLVTDFYGSDAVFNLSIPECTRLDDPPDLTKPDTEDALTLSVSGSRARLIHLTSPGGSAHG